MLVHEGLQIRNDDLFRLRQPVRKIQDIAFVDHVFAVLSIDGDAKPLLLETAGRRRRDGGKPARARGQAGGFRHGTEGRKGR